MVEEVQWTSVTQMKTQKDSSVSFKIANTVKYLSELLLGCTAISVSSNLSGNLKNVVEISIFQSCLVKL